MIEQDDLERLAVLVERVVEEQIGELSDQIVQRVVAELVPHLTLQAQGRRPDPSAPLVDAVATAAYLSVRPQWVYGNAVRLRARRLGRKALRFDLTEVDELLLRRVADG